MSSELAEGREVGPPSDVFSLGAALAFAATGQGPFGSGSTPALVYRVVYCAPQLDLVPAEVRPLIDRCLAKDPARRPTAHDLLSATMTPPPSSSAPPSPATSPSQTSPSAGNSSSASAPAPTTATPAAQQGGY